MMMQQQEEAKSTPLEQITAFREETLLDEEKYYNVSWMRGLLQQQKSRL